MKDFSLWTDGIGLIEYITVYLTMSLIVLKVLGMLNWSWFKVLLPSIGFLLIFILQLIHLVLEYDKEHNSNGRVSSKNKKKV